MAEGDWVKEHRAVMEHPIWHDDWLYRLFRWCIMKANFAPGRFKGVEIPVGSFVTGTLRGSEELGVTTSKFHRGIHRLTEPPYEVIVVDAKRDWTMITVCNYRTYQSPQDDSETPAKCERNASETPAKTIEELKNSRTQSEKGADRPLFVFVDLPDPLNTPEFRAAWQLWEQHRKEIKHKLTPTTTKQQLKELSGWGPQRAIAAIEHSIRGGYQGIFEPPESARGVKQQPQAPALPFAN